MARPLTQAEQDEIWDLVMAGGTFGRVGRQLGRHFGVVASLVARTGGVRPPRRTRAPERLTLQDREDIAAGVAAGESARAIARRLGRSPSTISRELERKGGRTNYRPSAAERARAARPKPSKLALNEPLREQVVEGLKLQWSPAQIAGWIRIEFPCDPEMWVSHETIYLSLFVQSRGLLNKELTKELRSGRVIRRAGRVSVRGQGRGKIVDAIHIRERPTEADDRAGPGHWEGDMLSGAGNTHIAILVERTSRFVMLVKLHNETTDAVIAALTAQVQQLPQELKRSLTWDRGLEMAKHKQFTVDTGVQVYFCDLQSPWQRGTNEKTNALLRQYFPRGMNLKDVTQDQLNEVAARLNGRPRKTLGFVPPSRKLSEVLQ